MGQTSNTRKAYQTGQAINTPTANLTVPIPMLWPTASDNSVPAGMVATRSRSPCHQGQAQSPKVSYLSLSQVGSPCYQGLAGLVKIHLG